MHVQFTMYIYDYTELLCIRNIVCILVPDLSVYHHTNQYIQFIFMIFSSPVSAPVTNANAPAASVMRGVGVRIGETLGDAMRLVHRLPKRATRRGRRRRQQRCPDVRVQLPVRRPAGRLAADRRLSHRCVSSPLLSSLRALCSRLQLL